MKRIFRITLIIMFLFSSGLYCSLFATVTNAGDVEIVDRIVAVVNEEIITLSELNEFYQPEVERIKLGNLPIKEERKRLFQMREILLDRLINKKLAEQEIKKKKITISDKEVTRTIERIKENKMFSDEDLRAHIADMGMTMEEYRSDVKDSILKNKLVSYEISSKVIITQEDIKSFYEQNTGDYGSVKKYQLRNIAMKVPQTADEDTRQAALTEMSKVSEKLKQGASLESIQKEYETSQFQLIIGDLGAFKMNELSEQLQTAIKDKNKGDYTPVMAEAFGYQIIFIEDIVETAGKSLEAASDEIREKLYKKKMDEEYLAWVENLRKKSHIKIIK